MKKLLKQESIVLDVISEIYITIMILLFPLIVDSTGFFRILECKWHSYLIISSMYIISIVGCLVYYSFIKKVKYLKYVKFSIVQWLAVAFLVINIISCFASPFFGKNNLFVGVGRGEGLIMMSLYTITFLFVSLFAKFKRKYILYFSISSILVNIISILQYVGFNPLNMYQDGIGTHNVSFMGTIGNINFISAMYCILMSISFLAFIFLEDETRWQKVIHLLSILMGVFIFGIINVLSGKVAFFTTLVLILPFIMGNNKRLSRFGIMVATILSAYCINVILNPEYHYDIGKLGLYFQFNYIVILYMIVIGLLIFLSFKIYKVSYDITSNKNIIKYFYLSIASCSFLGLVFLYCYDFKSGMLHEVHEIMHGNFDDDFGTYRMFLWKRTLKIFPEYPVLGSGPDSFAIRFMDKYTDDVASIGELTLNDTAGNVYLTMLINIGFVGLFSYLGFVFVQLKKGVKEMNDVSRILLITIICYLIQDCFNLSVVIITPMFWLVMALHYSSIRNDKKEIS